MRLLNLAPSGGDILGCELLVVSLDKLPQYEALSYSWDAQVPTSNITCDGRALPITANCEAALRRLRRRSKTRLLWIDSICIDQTSILERNVQVPLMGEIYGKAQRVIIWLGENTPQIDLAFKYVSIIYNATVLLRTKTRGKFLDTFMFRFEGTLLLKPPDLEFRLIVLPEECKKYYEQNTPPLDGLMQDIFSRSWFHRIWTVQEVALAQRTLVLCGSSTIDFVHFLEGSTIVSEQKSHSGDDNLLVGRAVFRGEVALHARIIHTLRRYDTFWMKILKRLLRAAPESERTTLNRSRILELARWKQATEARDKVYALYGLFSALGISITQQPDYGKSIAQIYEDETRAAIKEDGMLGVFYSITGTDRIPNLPSWVPDWSDTESPRCANYYYCAASGKSLPAFDLHPYVPRLSCIGRILDVVDQVADRPLGRLADNTKSQFQNTILPIQQWAMLCDPQFLTGVEHLVRRYVTTEPVNEAFCQMLVRGSAPILDVDGYMDLPRNKIQRHGEQRVEHLKNCARCWFPIVTSSTSEVLYSRLDDYPDSIVSDELETAITRALEGTPTARYFHRLVLLVSEGLIMFKTRSGLMGTALPIVQPGDIVALITGLRMPFILRPVGYQYRILGPAYVHGAMSGEYWAERPPWVDITFVLI